MKKQLIAIAGSSVLVLSLAAAGVGFADARAHKSIKGSTPVSGQSEAEFPAMAKISLEQAMRSAVESAPGQVLKAQFENEDGFLVCSVEVAATDGTVTEVVLDAGSGRVLCLNQDNPDREDHEQHDHEERESDE